MSTNYTQNYHLSQWSRSDKVLMEEFNADNAKIDAALAGKAEAASVTALSRRVDGKADVSSLNSLAQTVTSHGISLAGKGNCRIYTGSYTGTGTYGKNDQSSFTFPKRPVLIFIGDCGSGGRHFLACYSQSTIWTQSSSPAYDYISWSGTTMSWYSDHSE